MSRPTNLKPAEVSVRFALVFLRLEASVHRLRPTLSLLLLLFSYQVVSNSPWPHGLKHTRLPCPSPSPGVCSSSCPLSQWCHPTISSFVTFFSSAFNLSQHQGLCQWVSCSHQVAKVLELQFHTSYEIKVLLLSKRQPKSLKTTILGNSVSRCRWPPLRPTSSQVSPEGTCLFKNGGPRGGWTGGKMTKRRQSSTFDTCR